jgi:alkylhydroperoxidase family enzyme
MRISYVSNPPQTSTPEEADILARVQARRGEHGLIPLDLALLHSFPVADGWNSFLGAIRTKTSIPADIREMCICRIAAINGAWFEWESHAPILKAAGMSEEGLRIVKDVQVTELEDKAEKALSYPQRAVLRYTDAMTKVVKVPEEVFQGLKDHFGEKDIVEITATVAAYNCVSRFLVALDVAEMNQ